MIHTLARHDWIPRLGDSPLATALGHQALWIAPLVIALSLFSFRTIEKPFLRHRVGYLGDSGDE